MENAESYHLPLPSPTEVNRTEVLTKYLDDPKKLQKRLHKYSDKEYLPWEKVKHKYLSDPVSGFSAQEVWFLLQYMRSIGSKETLISKVDSDEKFTWMRFDKVEWYLRKIDISVGGNLLSNYKDTSKINKDQFLIRGVIEEAIASSQLEGAHTTRRVAKKMILDKREPRDKSERMILNNFQTIQFIDQREIREKNLDLELLFEIHAKIVDKIEDRESKYRLRKDSDNIVVSGLIGGKEYTTHIPPKEKELKRELKKLFRFVNNQNEDEWVHPVIKAIMIHFWIGYLHPFCDGNGRLARTIFYWYLLKQGYWGFKYIPISRVIKESPNKYAMAYIYTEQINSDLTYFIDYNLRKISQAIDDFEKYIEKLQKKNSEFDQVFGLELNQRQKLLLHDMMSDNTRRVTIEEYSRTFNVVRQTASIDLHALVEKKLLKMKKIGTKKYFLK